jgi:pimeloyl-ACP methyl ester carboxylesterase
MVGQLQKRINILLIKYLALVHGALGKLQQASWLLTLNISRKQAILNGNLTQHIQLSLYAIKAYSITRAIAFARIESHFFVNGGWMRDGQLIEEAYKIKHLPIIIIQGRYDVVCPAKTSWSLYQALGGENSVNVEYKIINDCGHSAHEKGIEEALVDAADKFKNL